MNIQATCVSCMIDQVNKALKLLKPGITNDDIVSAQKKVMVRFGQLDKKSAPYHGQLIYRTIGEILNDPDPYKDLKKKYNKLAQELSPKLVEVINHSKDPLLDAINIAILGNCVDFGTPHELNLEKEVDNYSLSNLKINHFPELKSQMNDPNIKNIMIIGDNTGEIVFDKIMVEFLVKEYPDKHFIYAVRGAPAINDATIEDARDVGMMELCEVVEGSESPGVILEEATERFQEVFQNSDIILSKGQGNFESLDNIETDADIYFLLKTKCPTVANMFNVKLGSLVLYHRKSTKDFKTN